MEDFLHRCNGLSPDEARSAQLRNPYPHSNPIEPSISMRDPAVGNMHIGIAFESIHLMKDRRRTAFMSVLRMASNDTPTGSPLSSAYHALINRCRRPVDREMPTVRVGGQRVV